MAPNHNDSLIGDNGGDILTDLSGHDWLIGTVVGAFTGQAGQLMIVEGFFDGISRPAVLIDLNGDAVEDAFLFVDTTSGALPSATDFIL